MLDFIVNICSILDTRYIILPKNPDICLFLVFFGYGFSIASKLEFHFRYFFLSHFASIISDIEKMQHMMISPCCRGNNQDAIYELSVVYIEGTKDYSRKVWALSGLRSLNYS